MFALLLIVFCFVFVIVKIVAGNGSKGRNTQFHKFNDPGNFVNPFNDFNN